VKLKVPVQRANRFAPNATEDNMASLFETLSRLQRFEDIDKTSMARSIGYAVGVNFASRVKSERQADIGSELCSLFRRLNLGKVTIREWAPLVIVTRPGSPSETIKGAFSEGVLNGVINWRLRKHVFVRYALSPRKGHIRRVFARREDRSARKR